MRQLLPSLAAIGLAITLPAGCTLDLDDGVLDPIEECATCAGKADSWAMPAEESCEATSMLRLANEAEFSVLDDDAGLNRQAVESIFEAREAGPLPTLRDLDDVPYVGVATLRAILAYAHASGLVAECDGDSGGEPEVGLISDLDKTVVPPAGDLDLPEAPYPGVTTLYRILEHGSSSEGVAGDTTYVTARTEDRVEDLPEWLAEHGLPAGAIETGVSGVPWIAQAEKVRDINRVMDDRPGQSFVLFGDTSHRDPEAYREVLAARPEQVVTGLIHMVNQTVSEDRLEGLHLHHHYAEAAAILAGLGVIEATDAWDVYTDAVDEGLELSEEEFEALLEAHAP